MDWILTGSIIDASGVDSAVRNVIASRKMEGTMMTIKKVLLAYDGSENNQKTFLVISIISQCLQLYFRGNPEENN